MVGIQGECCRVFHLSSTLATHTHQSATTTHHVHATISERGSLDVQLSVEALEKEARGVAGAPLEPTASPEQSLE